MAKFDRKMLIKRRARQIICDESDDFGDKMNDFMHKNKISMDILYMLIDHDPNGIPNCPRAKALFGEIWQTFRMFMRHASTFGPDDMAEIRMNRLNGIYGDPDAATSDDLDHGGCGDVGTEICEKRKDGYNLPKCTACQGKYISLWLKDTARIEEMEMTACGETDFEKIKEITLVYNKCRAKIFKRLPTLIRQQQNGD